ncbi:DUF3311 domain-containing protein [Longispora albida]|uniref:DUF3311 domain-containing protein n=1 Tax=Longispora albida TaxID=203523 RepID=UPI000475FD20|nr:DUF3311 domain-containing protein [Longispora albida]
MPEPHSTEEPGTPGRSPGIRSQWGWLLAVPVIIPLLTFLYNGDGPRLLGFPRFYWLQLAFIAIGVTTTTIVYRRGRA